MKNLIKNFLKSNKTFYKCYHVVFSLILKILGLFIKVQPKQILFVVYGGKRYDDSPRFVYEYMKKSGNYDDYKYVWAFDNVEENLENISEDEVVKIDTISYFIKALQSGYWITNSSCARGLKFKQKKTKNIFFSHGTAGIKKIGFDLSPENTSFGGFNEKFEKIFIQGTDKEISILKHAWNVDESVLHNLGLPRNDELFEDRDFEKIEKLKMKLDVPLDKKVILYAPTFREYKKDSKYANYLSIPFDFALWEKELSEDYVLLVTAHYEVSELLNIPKDSNFVFNAFKYPYINDLILISDILVSDYSSIILDYLITGNPYFSYSYDFKEYSENRGLYDGYEEIFLDGPFFEEKELINRIKNIDEKKYNVYAKKQKKIFLASDSPVVASVVKNIFEEE